MRNKVFFMITAFLVSSSLYAVDCNFENMDANDDGKVSEGEFLDKISDLGTHSDLDLDNDGYLDKDEFRETDFDYGLYSSWDSDDDDLLDDDEFYGGLFYNYDWNEDGYWDEDEWDDAVDGDFWDF